MSASKSTPHINPWFAAKSQMSQIDPFDRDDIRDKIDRLLKLALKNNHQACSTSSSSQREILRTLTMPAPPSTPISCSPNTSSSTFTMTAHLSSPKTAHFQHNQAQSSPHVSHKLHHQNSSSSGSSSSSRSQEAARKRIHGHLWKELYDYFEYYGDRATNFEQIDRRLETDRAKIPAIIANVMSTDFTGITSQHLEQTMRDCMKTPADYLSLASHRGNYNTRSSSRRQ